MNTRRKQPTIRDVAKLADVSYQTVSLVINGKPGVSEKTRARIVQLMEDMDFHPNRAAQMLSTRRSNTLELVVVDVMYGGRLADSTKNMVQTARAHGYGLLISETDKAGLSSALESAVARLEESLRAELGAKLEKTLAVPKDQVEAIVSKTSRQVIEHVAWEVLPELAERLIKNEINRVKDAFTGTRS